MKILVLSLLSFGLWGQVNPAPGTSNNVPFTTAPCVTAVRGDMACAMAGDTTISVQTITGGICTATTCNVTVTASTNFYVGVPVTVVGASPAGYNLIGTVANGGVVTAIPDGTHITYANTANPGNWSSGGTISLTCGNQATDAISATPYSFASCPIAGGSFGTGTSIESWGQYRQWSLSGTPPSILMVRLVYGNTNLYNAGNSFPVTASYPGYVGEWSFNITSLNAGLLASTFKASTLMVTTPSQLLTSTRSPQAIDTSSSQPLGVVIGYAATAVASGTYTSGISATGSAGQTCALTSFNNSSTATATVALTGTNTIAGGTALVITSRGISATAAPTTATAGNGTATCSGTATIATVLGGAAGNALDQLTFSVRKN